MMVLKRRWTSIMEEVRGRVAYCVYVDVADSFLVVIIKLHWLHTSLPYL